MNEGIKDVTLAGCVAQSYGQGGAGKPMELGNTVGMMLSPDYKERFRAEYDQLKIRRAKLESMLERYDAGTLDFVPTCPVSLLREQAYVMGSYIRILEARAEIERVELCKN